MSAPAPSREQDKAQDGARLRFVEAVFDRGQAAPRRWRVLALATTSLLYGVLAGALSRTRPSLESWSAEVAARIHADLMREQVVDLARPVPPPPPPELVAEKAPPPAPVKPAAPKPADRSARRAEAVRPPPPAQAGAVVAQEPAPNQPVDLTANTFVQGSASAYAGGTTTASGTSTTAVHSREVDPNASARDTGHPSRARPVQLEEEDWNCPWPHEADAEQIDEQVALVQVAVDAEGRTESVTVLADPGFGFGPTAAECARRAHYTPALDEEGRPVRSRTPPLRVRFTR